jgi:hypothetical protein
MAKTRKNARVVSFTKSARAPAAPTSEQIAARAYELFVARGGEHGHDVEDWLAAERELTEAHAALKRQSA